MHHRQWHPNGTRIRTSFTWWSRPQPPTPFANGTNGTTVGVPTVTSSEEQPLYLDFLPGVCGAGDENRTRVLSLGSWPTRISANYSDVLWLVDKLRVLWQTVPHVSVRAMDARWRGFESPSVWLDGGVADQPVDEQRQRAHRHTPAATDGDRLERTTGHQLVDRRSSDRQSAGGLLWRHEQLVVVMQDSS